MRRHLTLTVILKRLLLHIRPPYDPRISKSVVFKVRYLYAAVLGNDELVKTLLKARL